jgi:hypothetical protein
MIYKKASETYFIIAERILYYCPNINKLFGISLQILSPYIIAWVKISWSKASPKKSSS